MTRNQLDNLLRAHGPGGSTPFFFQSKILRLILALAMTALEVAGVPSLSAPTSFAAKEDMAAFFRDLVTGNGYKLVLRTGVAKLCAYLVLRFALPYQQTFTASYTARCGVDKDGTGNDVTRTATSTISQQDADNQAQALAVAALVCTIGGGPTTPTYARTLTVVNEAATGYGISLAGVPGGSIDFNDVASQGGNPLTMILVLDGSPVAQIDYDPVYDGKTFVFRLDNGTPRPLTFQVSNGYAL